MKFKSLLTLAAAALMGFSAYAQNGDVVVDANDYLFSDEEVYFVEKGGDPVTILISLQRLEENLPYGADFTNIQFNLLYPEGVRPAMDEYDAYLFEADGVRDKRGNAKVTFACNCDMTDKYPDHMFIGSNTTKFKVEANPCSLVEIYVKADADMASGNYDLKWHSMKYTCYSDEKVQNHVGAENAAKLCTIKVRPTAVETIDAAKAVSSVKYYNAAGMASDNAFEGVNIVVTKYNDGSQQVTKVVK